MDLVPLQLQARFDHSKRRIYRTPIGDCFSVTSILSATKDEQAKQALAEWKAREMRAGRDLKAGAKRGSAVHDLVERFLRGDTDPRCEDIEIASYFYSLLGILDSVKLPVLLEAAIYHPMGYAGRIDCLAINAEDELILYDWKTSGRFIPKSQAAKWKEDYLLQVSAYVHALNFMYANFLHIDQAVIAIAYPHTVSNFALEIKMDSASIDHNFEKFCQRFDAFQTRTS